MGKFAQAAAQGRGNESCVAGRWISENFDEEDLTEFVRLVSEHKWDLIVRLSDNNLRTASLKRHVHGDCVCSSDAMARGCCDCDKAGDNA